MLLRLIVNGDLCEASREERPSRRSSPSRRSAREAHVGHGVRQRCTLGALKFVSGNRRRNALKSNQSKTTILSQLPRSIGEAHVGHGVRLAIEHAKSNLRNRVNGHRIYDVDGDVDGDGLTVDYVSVPTE
jgi:hypothetical protein